MLRELQIKNVAVIDEVSVEFGNGFNVLTGETGAGKSILIDSINMALGSRASRDIIRSGCDKAFVSACFEISDKRVLKQLEEFGIETEDDVVLISRQINTDGKSVSRINGMIVPATVAREITGMLVDIHGQNDNQALLCSKNHMGFLDEYGNLYEKIEEYRKAYKKMQQIEKEIETLSINEEEKGRRLELSRFQAQEINAARLKANEDSELEEKRNYLYNMESIVSGTSEAYAAIYGAEENSAYDILRRAARSLSDVVEFDKKLAEGYDRLESVIAEVEDVASELNSRLSGTEFNMAELDAIEERLDLISNLKRKYGNSIEEILEYGKKAELEAENIEKSDERIFELREELKEASFEVEKLGAMLSDARKMSAIGLEEKIMTELKDLDMPRVKFAVGIEKKTSVNGETEYSEHGCDDIEFLISTNPGENLKPMSKIASGGELSRIMLAIKSILADAGLAETMIFDEIDTGVSGRAAQKIAEKICRLAEKKQIFSITHLAQIAAMADNQYLIKKNICDDKTSTTVNLLDYEARCEELARIIGGVSVTELTLKNAREMLAMAEKYKASQTI